MHDTETYEEYEPTQRSARGVSKSNPRSQAERTIVGDYVASGHGIHVISPEWKRAEAIACRYCGTDIPTPHEETPCEFPAWPMDDCQCNGCLIREGKLQRRAGRPREVCGSDLCRKAHNRARAAESRARRKAAQAA